MPRCPSGSRRCPPKTGKCHKNKGSVHKRAKHNRTAKKSVKSVVDSSPMPKLKWIDHLKMCTKKFNIKYGEAMTDPRCLKLYRESR